MDRPPPSRTAPVTAARDQIEEEDPLHPEIGDNLAIRPLIVHREEGGVGLEAVAVLADEGGEIARLHLLLPLDHEDDVQRQFVVDGADRFEGVKEADQRPLLIHDAAIDQAFPEAGEVADLPAEGIDHPVLTNGRLHIVHAVVEEGARLPRVDPTPDDRVQRRRHDLRFATERDDLVPYQRGHLGHPRPIGADRGLAHEGARHFQVRGPVLIEIMVYAIDHGNLPEWA